MLLYGRILFFALKRQTFGVWILTVIHMLFCNDKWILVAGAVGSGKGANRKKEKEAID